MFQKLTTMSTYGNAFIIRHFIKWTSELMLGSGQTRPSGPASQLFLFALLSACCCCCSGIISDEIITCAEERSMMDGRSFRSERRMCSAVRSSSLSLAIASWEDWVLCTACYSSSTCVCTTTSKLRRGAERFDSAGRGLLDGSIWSHYNTDSPVSRQELVAFIDVDVYVPCTITAAAAAALSYRVRFSVLAAAAATPPPPAR